jgi:death-on-curing protein
MILTVDEAVTLHEKIIAATGGSSGIRDMGLLESAVLGSTQTFGGVEFYPTDIEKASKIAFGICQNHPFIDGNKRTAVTAMLVALRMNGIILTYTQKELIELGLGIAEKGVDYEGVVGWVNTHNNASKPEMSL